MVAISILCAAMILLLAVGQVVAALLYSRKLCGGSQVVFPDSELPKAVVILSLRGGDDGLRDCLDRLARQNYPAYELRIIVDSLHDPAHQIVRRWLQNAPAVSVTVDFLRQPSERSTLKCSAIRQAIRTIDPDVGAVVLVDGDADPYPHWLRDLTSPLCLPGVGAVTGNRWYYPNPGSLGGWCRYIYNGLALPAMDLFNLPWAGSLAIRRDVAVSTGFAEALESASSDEQTVCKALRLQNLKLHFNPQVILWNPEATSLSGCYQFVFRQLLWTRLYHPAWKALLTHALGSYALLLIAFLLGATARWTHLPNSVTSLLLASLGCYLAATLWSLQLIDRTIRDKILPRQGCRCSVCMSLQNIGSIVTAAFLTLGLYTLAILNAWRATGVVWRGIEYQIDSSNSMRIVTYTPYADPVAEDPNTIRTLET